MLVDKQLPSLVGGVSQQPATVRLASQAEEIKNAWLSVVDGAGKRNPTQHIATLTADDLGTAFLHTINRDVNERYLVVLDGSVVRVFDLEGNEKTVKASEAATLTTFFAANGLDVSIGETFFLTGVQDTDDTAFATAKGSARADGDAFQRSGAATVVFVSTNANMLTALGSVALVVSGADLTAFFAGAGAGVAVGGLFKGDGGDTADTAFATAKGSAPAVNDIWKRTGAAAILFAGSSVDLTAAEAAPLDVYSFAYLAASNPLDDFVCVTVADYTFILNRDVIVRLMDTDGQPGSSTDTQPTHQWTMIPRYPGGQSDEPVQVSLGGFIGQRARQNQYTPNPSGGTLQGTVQTFQDLPTGATSGDIYKVEGSADSAFAAYYVRSAGNNVWNETVALGLRNRIDATTMPHALVRKSDGTFEFGPFSWADRKVGDETTNANPSFVGREIRDIFWYKNRFGVAVDEGVVMTRFGDFGNFYRLTVVDVLADDRIDVQASETKVTKINYAVPFDGSIMLFSDQTQLRLNHGPEGLTPSNATLDVVTNFKMVPNVRPFALGNDVYFAQENGEWATIREYYVAPDSQSNDAANVTGHVSKYIPRGVRRISGSDPHDLLMVLPGVVGDVGGTSPNTIFVYKFHWVSETEKAQSAWNKYVLATDDEILSAEVLDSKIYLLIKRSDGAHLESISLQPDARISETINFQLYLDRMSRSSNPTYSAGGNHTTWTLPYDVEASARADFLLLRDDSEAEPGTLITADPADFTWPAANQVRITGDFSGINVFCGLLYEFRYEFSEQFARNQQDVPMLNGKLLLRNWTVYFKDTPYFQIEVSPYGAAAVAESVIPALKAQGQALTQRLAYFETEVPVAVTGQYQFGVYGESTEATVAIVSRSPYATTLVQAEYEGFYHKRSKTI
jgi:hypothetical protein